MPKSVNYDQVAPSYDRRYAEHNYDGIAHVLDHFALPGQRVLEIGCGTGHWIAHLRSSGRVGVGLDRSAGMLARAAERCGRDALVLARGEALPFRDGSFDRVVAINALHHFDDPARFCAEARRVLCDGGRVAVIGLDPTQGGDDWYVYEYFERTCALDLARYASTRQIATWLEGAGFHDCREAVAERIQKCVSARDALDRGLVTKESTSQLTLLDDAEFAAGLDRIRSAVARAEAAGEDLQLRVDLQLYVTFGTAARS